MKGSACGLWGPGVLALLLTVGNIIQARAQFGNGDFVSDRSAIQVGRVAPSWKIRNWINSPPLSLSQLQGKVVLLRFFSDNPLSAAALNEFYRDYRERGFMVVGIYTPQPMPTATDVDYVRRLASAVGFEFPIGVDGSWETVNRYWLNEADADMGAASFLLDRKGVIRVIQGRGIYEKDSKNRTARREYEALKRQIEALLQEDAPGDNTSNDPSGPAQ